MYDTNTLLYKNIPLTLYSRKGDVSCVWEVSWRPEQTVILTQSSSHDHSSTSSLSWLVLINCGSAVDSQFGSCIQLIPTDPNCTGDLSHAHLLPLIYTGASLDWHIGRGWICYTAWKKTAFYFNGHVWLPYNRYPIDSFSRVYLSRVDVFLGWWDTAS